MIKGSLVISKNLTTLKLIVDHTAPQVKYKEKYEKVKGQYIPVEDTPQILHAKSVRNLASEVTIFIYTSS